MGLRVLELAAYAVEAAVFAEPGTCCGNRATNST